MNFLTFVHRANPEVPTNPVQLPRGLALSGNCILMVEVRDRLTSRTLQPWLWNRLEIHEDRPNLHVLTYTPALPSKAGFAPSALAQFRSAVERGIAAIFGSDRPTLLLFSPNEARFKVVVPDLKFVYRVIDDYPTMPFYAADPEGCRLLDERLCREALAVAPSNPKLLRQRAEFNPNHILIPNGVDYDHFSAPTDVPHDIGALPHPVIGFAGALDSYKMDWKLVAELAALRPDWSWILIGKIGVSDGTHAATLPKAPNLHYLGFRAYQSLPGYLKSFDVGMIPYAVNDYTEGISPLKLYEYLAVGLPVVSTPLPFAREAGEAVRVGHDAKEFVHAIESALAEQGREDHRKELAKANSWEVRGRVLVDYLRSLGLS